MPSRFLTHPGVLRTVPFGLFILLLAAGPLLEVLLLGGMDPRWLYGLRSLLTAVVLLSLWRSYDELRHPLRTGIGDSAVGLATGALVFVLWIHLDLPVISLERGEGFNPTVDGKISLSMAAIRMAGATLVVPVMEELFWRSFILRVLERPAFLAHDPETVGWTAILISSAVFASEHRLWLAGFLAGIAYAWLYKRSGNLWVPILAHAVTNALLGIYVLVTGSWWFW